MSSKLFHTMLYPPIGRKTSVFVPKKTASALLAIFLILESFLMVAPHVAEAAVDPQQLNGYSYVRNNPNKYVDPEGKEIVINGSDDFVSETTIDLQNISPAVSVVQNEGVNNVTFDSKRDVSGYESGSELINSLVSSKYTITIDELPASVNNASARPNNFLKSLFGLKTGSQVSYSPYNDSIALPLYSGSSYIHYAAAQSKIVLAHELIHAYHNAAGDRYLFSTDYKGLDGGSYRAGKEEVYTVFGSPNSSNISENAIRSEQGLLPRNNY